MIAALRERLNVSSTLLQQVVLGKEIKTNSEYINVNTECIESLAADINDATEELNNEAIRITSKIEKNIDGKVQIAFTKSVRSQQVKSIATDATVDIMIDDNYVQKLVTKHVNNKVVLVALKIAVNR